MVTYGHKWSQLITNGHKLSQMVTSGHKLSQLVTNEHKFNKRRLLGLYGRGFGGGGHAILGRFWGPFLRIGFLTPTLGLVRPR